MNAPPGYAPRPPRHIEAEMEAAGAAGDDLRLSIARAHYRSWLTEQGIDDGPHGSEMPDEAIR